MPQVVVEKRKKLTLRVKLIILLGVILMVLAGFGLYLILKPSAKDVVKHTDDLSARGNSVEAYKRLKAEPIFFESRDDKMLVLSRLAPTCLSLGRPDEAIKYQLQLYRLAPDDYSIQLTTAELAKQVNNKPVAIEAYQRAIEHLRSSPRGAFTDYQIQRFELYLNQLKASK